MYHGILVVWKPKGLTSHDVVFKLRRLLKMSKIGHTGTLDPQVEGVLVVCLGKATKLVQYFTDSTKEYEGQVTLGYSTETEDAFGEVVKRVRLEKPLDNQVIDKTIDSFKGEIVQVPPMYSAVKVNGKRLYEYARAGEKVERPKRRVQIQEFLRTSDTDYDLNEGTMKWDFYVKCGKGTYVRTLAVDLGEKLGYPAHMSRLTRIATGGFNKDDAFTLEDIEQMTDSKTIGQAIHSIESSLVNMNSINISKNDYNKIKNGQVLPEDYFSQVIKDPTVLYYQDKAISIYQAHPSKNKLIKPKIMFE